MRRHHEMALRQMALRHTAPGARATIYRFGYLRPSWRCQRGALAKLKGRMEANSNEARELAVQRLEKWKRAGSGVSHVCVLPTGECVGTNSDHSHDDPTHRYLHLDDPAALDALAADIARRGGAAIGVTEDVVKIRRQAWR